MGKKLCDLNSLKQGDKVKNIATFLLFQNHSEVKNFAAFLPSSAR